ncbi:1-phosphofructokinase family hexose kinase [Rhodopseudomonas sp. HC1]|uniref:1-phosphofructokinase family hexose kinase n=1 Tax=Rhodopseudomonas infernalis TaxID=2897386 RepID=UPI001EE7F717|nr:1-phosphofructokinase family hexose kinase [Rhodopseudomonas infernalis]MCG6206433.1 1-phosphofructokinase family hexose kinase [Rhodopseudomonas infernalis]
MVDIVTLTPNPAIDLSTSVERLVPSRKLRCAAQQRDPGGGGINVARVVKRFGGDVEAIYPAGGFTGRLLRSLLDREQIPSRVVESEAETREDFSVTEAATGQQFRFVLPGLPLAETEWRGLLEILGGTEPAPKIVVGSGSLPPGVPLDFYAQAAAVAKRIGARFFLDTSGASLVAALDHGVTLIKPNLREMQELAGRTLDGDRDYVAAARQQIDAGKVEIVALSLGHLGALLVTCDEALRSPALPVNQVSTVGAGDSFLGAIAYSLAQGLSVEDGFRRALASGSASLTMHGTQLCRPADVERLCREVVIERL